MSELTKQEQEYLQQLGIGGTTSRVPDEEATPKKSGVTWDGPGKGKWLDSLLGGHNDGANPMFQSLNFGTGVITTPILEAVGKLTGRETKGDFIPNMRQALRGEAPSPVEKLQGMGFGPGVSWGIGLPMGAVADPFGSTLFRGAMTAKPMATLKSFAAQNTENAAGPMAPVAKGLFKTGKKIFSHAFRTVEDRMQRELDNPPPIGAFVEHLWNNGNPRTGGFRKSNMDIAKDVEKMTDEAGAAVGAARNKVPGTHDMAPDLDANLEEWRDSMFPPTGDAEKDALRPDPLNLFFQRIGSVTPEERSAALEVLRQSLPEGPDTDNLIAEFARELKQSKSAPGTEQVIRDFVRDLHQGARDMSELGDMKTSLGQAASKGQGIDSSYYQRAAPHNTVKMESAHLNQYVDKYIQSLMEANLGPESLDEYAKLKELYRVLKNAKNPMFALAEKASNRPWITKLDAGLGAFAAGSGSVPAAVAAGVGKVIGELNQSPRFATGTGKLLGRLGKTNIWDTMIRQGLTQKSLRKDREK
jgi:hypothetical protein